jgi:DnaJ domain/Tetratricopeptide repeat
MKTAYDLLGIRPDANDETIKTAFREAAKLHHPDRRPGDPHAGFRFRQIATANAILRDPERRADYDRWLALERRHMRSERTLAVISKAIDVAVFGVVLVIGLLWMEPFSMPEPAPRPESRMARGTIDPVPAPRPDAIVSDGAGARQEEIPAAVTAPSDAAPATSNDAVAEAIATPGPAPGLRPDEAEFHREGKPDASPVETVQPEVAVTDAAAGLGPKEATADMRLDHARDAIGDPDHALAVYDAAIRIVPDNPILFHDRGLMWRRKGDLDRALADLDRAIRFGFSDADFYNDRGLIWLEKGRYHRAIADFDRARQINPTLVDASINRDIALRRELERRSAGVD